MELKEFVKQVLTEVFTGVAEAQEDLKNNDSNGVINATSLNLATHPETDPYKRGISLIEMDVAVTVESGSSTRKGAGINVVKVFEAGGEKTGQSLNSTTSRVKFAVPVAYPYLKK